MNKSLMLMVRQLVCQDGTGIEIDRIDLIEFRSLQELLRQDFGITIDIPTIAETMSDAGIDFHAWNWNSGVLMHEAIYEHLQAKKE